MLQHSHHFDKICCVFVWNRNAHWTKLELLGLYINQKKKILGKKVQFTQRPHKNDIFFCFLACFLSPRIGMGSWICCWKCKSSTVVHFSIATCSALSQIKIFVALSFDICLGKIEKCKKSTWKNPHRRQTGKSISFSTLFFAIPFSFYIKIQNFLCTVFTLCAHFFYSCYTE